MKTSRSPEWQGKQDDVSASIHPVSSYLNPSQKTSIASSDKSLGSSHVSSKEKSKTNYFVLSFVAMVVFGLGNKIFQKLQTLPMRNYPNFVNLLTTFFYIPLSFAYIIPMIKYGSAITVEQRQVPLKKFVVMGALDSVAGIMQVFAATYLPGSLLILLGQAAVPISMAISRLLLKTKYSVYQYAGAIVVAAGLLIVLGPSLAASTASNPTESSATSAWSLVMILSCIPMCLSTVYKEKTLGDTELDAVYLNGWIAVFQFLLSLPLSIPAAMVGTPSVLPQDLLSNLYDGMKCFAGQNTIVNGLHPDECAMATWYVSVYLLFNVVYNLLIILILKYGSANILYLAMTIMVPLGNVAFTFSFVPGHEPLKNTDIVGLTVIMLGLCSYRFLEDIVAKLRRRSLVRKERDPYQGELDKSLLHNDDEHVYEAAI